MGMAMPRKRRTSLQTGRSLFGDTGLANTLETD